MTPDRIIGRTGELDAVARFFDSEPSGVRGLLIEGAAGIGKTTVWREAVRIAGERGLVLTSRASEAEARLSFTVLGDLLVPVLDDDVLQRLPKGQRRGLEAALLLAGSTDARPDQRTVSLAVLAVLRALAEERPVTVAVDDVQWVDAPSARTLTFALRRLEVEPVHVVVSRRLEPGSSEPLDLVHSLPGRLEHLMLAPIDEASLGRLLRRSLDREFPPPLVSKIHEQTAGNPFFAIEVGRALATQMPPLQPGEPLPVPRDLEELLRRRFSALRTEARAACLIIAAAPVPSRDIVETAGGAAAGIQEASDAGIVTIRGPKLEFTHPLLASTVYSAASARDRRRIHARLAEMATEPEGRARHLALSAAAPDDEVAKALEEAAGLAHARGAPLAAAELFELAAALTPPPSDLIRRRRLAAAENLFDAGDSEGAREMVEQVLSRLDPGPERADSLRILSFMCWNDARRIAKLLGQALDEVGDDLGLRSMVLSEMAWVDLVQCHPAAASDLAREALEIAEAFPEPLPKRLALKVLSQAEAVLGRPARHLVERAVALDDPGVAGESTSPAICQGRQLLWAGDVRSARHVLQAELERCLHQGLEGPTWEIVLNLADVEFRAGRWDRAAHHVTDALEIVLDTGRSGGVGKVLSVKAAIGAAMGHVEQARRDCFETLSDSERTGYRWIELVARSTLGSLELSLGDPAAAHAWLTPAVRTCEEMGVGEPGVFPFVPDEVEALVALGELDEAERLTDRLDEQGSQLDRALAMATAARCRGLISGARGELEGAAAHLERALAEHGRVEQPLETGRTLLAAGRVQRRMKRQRSARAALEEALRIFEELGAPLWAAQARADLERVGGAAVGPSGLTPTEWRVAELVAAGKKNREVADMLFISVKTVEANLTRIYHKLGVRSRAELIRELVSGSDRRN